MILHEIAENLPARAVSISIVKSIAMKERV